MGAIRSPDRPSPTSCRSGCPGRGADRPQCLCRDDRAGRISEATTRAASKVIPRVRLVYGEPRRRASQRFPDQPRDGARYPGARCRGRGGMSDDQRAQWDLLQGQQAQILDELRDLRLRVDTIEARFIGLETRVSSADMRLDTVDQRLSTIEAILIRMTA